VRAGHRHSATPVQVTLEPLSGGRDGIGTPLPEPAAHRLDQQRLHAGRAGFVPRGHEFLSYLRRRHTGLAPGSGLATPELHRSFSKSLQLVGAVERGRVDRHSRLGTDCGGVNGDLVHPDPLKFVLVNDRFFTGDRWLNV